MAYQVSLKCTEYTVPLHNVLYILVGDDVASFVVDVLPKLLLVHHSSDCKVFATIVLDYLSSDQAVSE